MKRYAGLIDPSGPSDNEWYQMIKIGRYLNEHGYELESASQAINPFLEGSRIEHSERTYLPAKEWVLELASSVCHDSPLERMVSSEIEKVLSYVLSVVNEDRETVSFLICWTDQPDRHPLKYALRVAKLYEIPTYNLRDTDDKTRFATFLSGLK